MQKFSIPRHNRIPNRARSQNPDFRECARSNSSGKRFYVSCWDSRLKDDTVAVIPRDFESTAAQESMSRRRHRNGTGRCATYRRHPRVIRARFGIKRTSREIEWNEDEWLELRKYAAGTFARRSHRARSTCARSRAQVDAFLRANDVCVTCESTDVPHTYQEEESRRASRGKAQFQPRAARKEEDAAFDDASPASGNLMRKAGSTINSLSGSGRTVRIKSCGLCSAWPRCNCQIQLRTFLSRNFR